MDQNGPNPVTVREFEEVDLESLLSDAGPRDLVHHRDRSQMHRSGEATYLIAWRDGRPCGRVTVFRRSKYQPVRDMAGDFPEMNALEATPRGLGLGSLLIASAEARATAWGADRIGLAVEHGNVGARRLYERLGYVEWDHGDVVDRWLERDASGVVVREHADRCSYLVTYLT